jgi:hypothetical protein
MTSYLLLRNNKESGPYSLSDLVSLGLKPYDLVWANGKSAAWRYPSELPELRQYAPPVEEQPFDRFYKKPSEEKKEEPVQPAARQSPVPAEAIPSIEQTPEPIRIQSQPVFTPRKSVFVTMPGQKQAPQPAATYKEPAPQPTAYQQYQPKVAEQLTEPDYLTKTITITENPVTAEIKYSQPLDEIKEMYVKTLQERKQRIANKTILVGSLKKIAVVLGIVGAGIMIGFFLKSNGDNNQVAGTQTPASATPQVQQLPLTPQTNTSITDQQPTASSQPDESLNQPVDEPTREQIQEDIKRMPLVKKETAPPVTEAREEPVTEEVVVSKSKKEVIQPKQKEKEITYDEPSPGVEVNERTGERSRKTRSNNTAPVPDEEEENTGSNQPVNTARPKAVMANKNLSKLVAVTTNEYQTVAFGGIRNLQLTVTNDSKYILDNVIVELAYLKPSEQPLRIELIPFRNVSPGGAMTIRVPDTNRGIKITYRIVSILSKESAKDMADL